MPRRVRFRRETPKREFAAAMCYPHALTSHPLNVVLIDAHRISPNHRYRQAAGSPDWMLLRKLQAQ
jgi:hypothetical protein